MGCLRYSSRTSLRYSRHLPTDHHSFPEPATKGATILNSLENECSLCQRRISTERGICPLCHSRVARQLGDLLTFWDAAHDELLPGKSGGGGRSSERTIGLNVNALSFVAGDDILALLHGWEVVIRQDRRLIPPALVPKLAGLRMEIEAGIAFATAHLAWSATQEWFGDFTRELTELHSAGMGAAKLFVKRARRVNCPSTQPDGSYCNALVNVSDRDPLEIFECRGCKAEWTMLSLVKCALSSTAHVWLDVEAISLYLNIPERQVYRLAKKHGIAKEGNRFDLQAIRHAVAI